MNRYRVILREEVTYVMEVEAEDYDDAIYKAENAGIASSEYAVDWETIDIDAKVVE